MTGRVVLIGRCQLSSPERIKLHKKSELSVENRGALHDESLDTRDLLPLRTQ